MQEKTDITIYKTKDYNLFKKIAENRSVKINSVLEAAILEENLLPYSPIIVNPNLEVVDGQHRIEIAKKHNLEIYFVIMPYTSSTALKNLNVGARNWTLNDYLHFYKKQGVTGYVQLDSYMNYGLSLSVILDCYTNSRGGSTVKAFKNGDFNFKYEDEKIKNSIKDAVNLKDVVISLCDAHYISQAFISSLIQITLLPEYDHNHFIKSIYKNPDALKKALLFNNKSNILDILINNIYNYKMKKNRLILN